MKINHSGIGGCGAVAHACGVAACAGGTGSRTCRFRSLGGCWVRIRVRAPRAVRHHATPLHRYAAAATAGALWRLPAACLRA